MRPTSAPTLNRAIALIPKRPGNRQGLAGKESFQSEPRDPHAIAEVDDRHGAGVDSTIVRKPLIVAVHAYAAEVPRYDPGVDLVGVAEIAERLGVGTSIVHDWRRRHDDFPAPALRLRMGLIWAWPGSGVRARATGRLSS